MNVYDEQGEGMCMLRYFVFIYHVRFDFTLYNFLHGLMIIV